MIKRNWLAVALMLGVSVFGVPEAAIAKDTKPAATATALLDLNTATLDQLNALPGIGEVKAKAIIAGRPYASLKDFESRGIVSASVLDKFKAQVTVAEAPAPAAPKPAKTEKAAATGPVDLNTATAEELTALPGIGEARAKAIIEGRPYASLKDFESRGIVAASTVEKFKGQVTVSRGAKAKPAAPAVVDEANPPEPTGKIDLNTATADELEVLPGIGPVRAKAIVEGRPYASLAEFEAKGIIAKSTVEKFRDAIEVVPVAKAGATAAAQGTPGQAAAQKRIRMCGAEWRGAKAENKIPAGTTWPAFWSKCNTVLKQRGY